VKPINILSFWKLILSSTLSIILLTSCSSEISDMPTLESTITSAEPTSPPTPETISESCAGVEGYCLELTFEGESERCIYEGPLELDAGSVELFFNNNSEGYAAINFSVLLDNKKIEDLIEWNGEEPTTKSAPVWSRDLGTWKPIPAGESEHWELELEPGDYFMVCARLNPLGVWLGTGLTVEQ
jgi:hypothetical protein